MEPNPSPVILAQSCLTKTINITPFHVGGGFKISIDNWEIIRLNGIPPDVLNTLIAMLLIEERQGCCERHALKGCVLLVNIWKTLIKAIQ